MQVQRNSGFAPDLFQGPETDARQIQDKAGKLAYLQKAFAAVQAATGRPVTASPAKVRRATVACVRHALLRSHTAVL